MSCTTREAEVRLRKTLSLFLVAMCACSNAADSTTPGDDDSSDVGGDARTFERTHLIDGEYRIDGTLELTQHGDKIDFNLESADLGLKREAIADGKGVALVEGRGRFEDGDCALVFDVTTRQAFVLQDGPCTQLAPEGVSFSGTYSLSPNKIITLTELVDNGKGEKVGDGVVTLLSTSDTAFKFDLFSTFGAIEGEIEFVDGRAEFTAGADCQLVFESLANVLHITQTGACAEHGEEGFSLSGTYTRE